MNIVPFYLHEAGSIPGVPNPDTQSGLWPGSITVYVDADTHEVVSTSPIGLLPDEHAEENQPALDAPAQAPAVDGNNPEQNSVEQPTN